jgi:hypothetical protein
VTAIIKRFYTRAEIGLKPPTRVNYNITPEQGGAALHYGGGGPNPAPTTVDRAMATLRSWQASHMAKGWADFAYTAAYDQLGNVYAGRGLGVRTAGQGSNWGNDDFHAFVWIGGGDAVPSRAALDAADWLIHYGRTKGDAGMMVYPHRKFTATSCPGYKGIAEHAALRHNKAIPLPDSVVVPVNPYTVASPGFPLATGHWFGRDDGTAYSHSGIRGGTDDDNVEKIQAHVNVWLRSKGKRLLTVDGRFGPATEEAVRSWQYANRTKIIDGKYNGKFGRNSWNFAF